VLAENFRACPASFFPVNSKCGEGMPLSAMLETA